MTVTSSALTPEENLQISDLMVQPGFRLLKRLAAGYRDQIHAETAMEWHRIDNEASKRSAEARLKEAARYTIFLELLDALTTNQKHQLIEIKQSYE